MSTLEIGTRGMRTVIPGGLDEEKVVDFVEEGSRIPLYLQKREPLRKTPNKKDKKLTITWSPKIGTERS